MHETKTMNTETNTATLQGLHDSGAYDIGADGRAYLYFDGEYLSESQVITHLTGVREWTTWGSVRGQGKIWETIEQARRDLKRDRRDCAAQGGYSDRIVCGVHPEGYLCKADGTGAIWPSHGRGHGAVRVDR